MTWCSQRSQTPLPLSASPYAGRLRLCLLHRNCSLCDMQVLSSLGCKPAFRVMQVQNPSSNAPLHASSSQAQDCSSSGKLA